MRRIRKPGCAARRAAGINSRLPCRDRHIPRGECLHQGSRINKLILLSTHPGGSDADRASAAVWSQLIDMSGTRHQQARRLLSLLFPSDVAESIYRELGDIVATARAQLSPDVINRQVAAMDAWHRIGIGDRLRKMNLPGLIATGTAYIVIPPSNAHANALLSQFFAYLCMRI